MDPLSQLQDIHLPEPVSWWPPAVGWWLLVLTLIIAVIASILYYRYWCKYRRYRKTALRKLDALYRQAEDDQECFLGNVASLLKRTAMQQQPVTATMHGEQWQLFLQQHMPEQPAHWIAISRYQPAVQTDKELVYHAARQWIKEH